MKNVKNDTRYIIKRILIGVGIAIILFNLKKCNVYAATYEYNYYVQYAYNQSNPIVKLTNTTGYNLNTSFEYTFRDKDFKINLYNYYNDNIYYVALNVGGESVYLLALHDFEYTFNSGDYISLYSLGQSYTTSQFNVSNFYVYNNNQLVYTAKTSNSDNNRVNSLMVSSTYYVPSYNVSGSVSNTSNSNFTTSLRNNTINVISSNFPVPIYLDENTLLYEPQNDPLSNYTQVDLTGYQAVLIVPKNYQTMLSDSSHTNESPPGVFRTYLDLEYYSQECVRGTLINVENVKDIMMNNIGVGTGSLAESITGTCYAEPTQTIMSYEFDQYSGLIPRGLLIYNGAYDWQSGFSEDSSFFGTSYVWYDPTMYNAYLVESFDNFNQTIQYKDYSGQDQEVTIESLPTFTESMENAIDNVDSPTPTEVNRQKLQAIFNFLKTPFTFINKLNTTSCSAIVFPLPFVNRNLTLECMSTAVYNRYLPNILKTFIITILNGLIFYRCTLNNIDIFTNILDPEDNKLEAIDL